MLINSGIDPRFLPSLPSPPHDTSEGSLLNQTVEIPASDQHIPARDQHIPTLDQLIHAPGLSTALDQNTPTLISTCEQNNSIRVVEQEIQEPNHGINISSVTLDQDMPSLGGGISALDTDNMPPLDLDAIFEIWDNDMLPPPMMNQSTDTEHALTLQIANNAMEELMKLLSMNEPFWFKSIHDGKFIFQREIYQKEYPRSNFLRGPVRIESSKDLREVNMNGAHLVEMFLNSEKWVDLFPTIVKRAQTIQEHESGLPGNRDGALQLMNAEIHTLSHLVPTREFVFLRYCKQIVAGAWVIGDVSVDSSKCKITPQAWRLPSGCLIQEMTPGLCSVSWVERVEVIENIQSRQIYKDVVGNHAYGAERWVSTLQRMCERFACALVETIPTCEAGRVIRSIEGRRSILQLAHRMVRTFCGTLDMKGGDTNFQNLTKINKGGVKVSVRVNTTEPGAPKGMILGAATTFRLPFSPQNVFDFLIDNKERPKWDVLFCGNEGHDIQRISTGTNPGNYISIVRPFIPGENSMMILQESYADALGSMLVYAPFDMDTISFAMKGKDTSLMPILPSGLTISPNVQSNVPEGQIDKSTGSLVTLMFQLLASSPSRVGMVDNEFVGLVKSLVTSTVEKIKVALNTPV
ncbi:hypothetical protein Fmac_004879 [Flemingia macrophylla]|uniref:START domain-containing protein n=1 Tax=Flemingia macrophylla TaxID=520843 RepID=A0ABD1N659_9FABA